MRIMKQVFQGLESIVVVYIDNIVVFTRDPSLNTHLAHVRKVLDRLKAYNFKLSPRKCEFAIKQTTFLGQKIGIKGYEPCDKNIRAIKKFPVPQNVRQTKSFVGMCSFFRHYVKNFSEVVKPLTHLIEQDARFRWTDEHQRTFEILKYKLISEPILTFADYNEPFHLFTDASSTAQGAVLMQIDKAHNWPKSYRTIGYWSRINSAPERKWSVVQLELSSIVLALRHFTPYIYGTKIIVHTDHRPLIYVLRNKTTHPNLARWAVELMQYDIEIEHIEGRRNRVADALSRIAETLTDDEVRELPTAQDIIEFPVSICAGNDADNEWATDSKSVSCLTILDSYKLYCTCI